MKPLQIPGMPVCSPSARKVVRVALINFLFYVLVAAALFTSARQYQQQAELTAQNLAYSLQESASVCFEKINIALFAVQAETEKELAGGLLDAAVLNAYIERERTHIPELSAIRIANAEGQVYYGLRGNMNGPTVRDREFFTAAAADPQARLRISHPEISRVTSKWVVFLARRLNLPNGDFAGVVYAVLPLEYFQQLIGSVDVGPHGVISVRHADMALVARAPQYQHVGAAVGNRTVSTQTLNQLRANPDSGSFETVVTLDGIHRNMAYRRTRGQPIYIFVGLASQDYLAPWHQQLYALLALCLGFSVTTTVQGSKAFMRRRNELQAMRELRAHELQLQSSEIKYRTLYDSISDAVWLMDEQTIIDCNSATLTLFGCASKTAFLRLSLSQLAPSVLGEAGAPARPPFGERIRSARQEQLWRFDWVHQRLDNGGSFDTEVLLSSVELDGRKVLQVMVRDISQRKRAEEQIRQLAYFDTLTKLPNRRLLVERLQQNNSAHPTQFGALLFVNLDNFRALNDIEGREAGDLLLVEVAARLRGCIRAGDTVARAGADEFIVLIAALGISHDGAVNLAHARAERIRAELCLPYTIGNEERPHYTTSSIGITLYLGGQLPADDVLKQGETALTHAKQEQRNTICLFNTAMLATLEARSALQAAMAGALQRQEFQLYYQAQVNHDGAMQGAEALLRWIPPGRAAVSPQEFIPLAEESGLIVPIGLWVLQTACAQLQRWSRHTQTRALTISINVSARQFRQRDFVYQVTEALERHQISPELLKLELTESTLLDSVDEVIERMHQIKALGVRISMDDFGTGFSSLSYLKRLPLDQLKIDQSFVRDIAENTSDAAIVHAILVMSQSLGVDVIAEGVETTSQRDFLAARGCQSYQGYLFGKPQPIADWDARFELGPADG